MPFCLAAFVCTRMEENMLSNRGTSAAQTWLKKKEKKSGPAAVTTDHWGLHAQMHTSTHTFTQWCSLFLSACRVTTVPHSKKSSHYTCIISCRWNKVSLKCPLCHMEHVSLMSPPHVHLSTLLTSPLLLGISLHPVTVLSLPLPFPCCPMSKLFVFLCFF